MNTNFHPIDTDTWARREEFDYFSRGGCGFTMTAPVDITRLYQYSKERGIKLYPLLVSLTARVLNAHAEFKYAVIDGVIGQYEVIHPMFFDPTPSGNVAALVAEYKDNLSEQLAEIERVRAECAGADTYFPQKERPANTVNISVAPWLTFSSMSFCLQYCAYVYQPIISFGKFEKKDGGVKIPLAVYCNHAVNDGGHCALVFSEFEKLASEL